MSEVDGLSQDREERGEAQLALALVAVCLQALAILVFRHFLAPLLDQRTHAEILSRNR